MNQTLCRAAPLLALSLAPLLAANAAPEPGACASAVATYHSAFTDYKPWRDIATGDWRSLNAGAVASPMAPMAGMHEVEASQSRTAAMPERSPASEPSHGRGAHGGAPEPVASAPHAGHSMAGGQQ